MFKKLVLAAILSLSHQASADQWEPIVNMVIEQFKSSGELAGVSSCLGVSESKFLSEYKPILRNCLQEHGMAEGEESEAKMDACFEKQILQRFNLSQSKFDHCKEQFSDNDEEMPEQDLSHLSDEEFAKVMEAQQQQSMKELESLNRAMRSASAGTENLVTLPIYKNSQIQSHFSMGMQFGDGQNSLPVAMFSSKDSVERVVEFYKKELSGFQHKNFDGMVIFMKQFPTGFDPLKDMKAYQSTPHVSIYSLGGSASGTTIEIAYKKR